LTTLTRSRAAVEWRVPLLGLAALRGILAVLAIPLAAPLWDRHFAVVVLLRPTKEVLLASGFRIREGELALPVAVLATVPLMLGGVWLFFWLGRAWSDEIRSGEGLPKWAEKVLPPKRICQLADVLEAKGRTVVFLGRLAVFPSAVMAAAAGVSGMTQREFLLADGLGAMASLIEVIGAGYLLGDAYQEGAHWLTAVGVVVLVAMLVLLGRWLRRQSPSRKGT
jgi:membrane protein DedA with SNARE-associated domain